MPEENLSFHGKVENENLHPIKKGILVAYNTENNLVYDIPLDSLGRFHIAVDDFTDGTSFFLASGKHQEQADIRQHFGRRQYFSFRKLSTRKTQENEIC